MTDPMKSMIERCKRDPWFLGFALDQYAMAQGFPADVVASRLGCSVEALGKMSLCRCPDPASPSYQADCEAIAAYGGCDVSVLSEILNG